MKPHDSTFTPEFLAACSNMELVALQHDLRTFPEDRRYLDAVLKELQRRQGDNGGANQPEDVRGTESVGDAPV